MLPLGEAGDALLDEDKPSMARTVEVTRRLYRSGESEYLIDGEICRLRDVHEFLMDTGLGAKAYAIIEQGKIGMILSSRPTDRRQLIEEAAGITKYKARRRAAELKLEAAQLNLTRLEDIIFELEKQFGSLKRQSAKARRYKRLRDELRHWEKVLFAGRYREAAGKIESIRGASRRRASARGGGGRRRRCRGGRFQPHPHFAGGGGREGDERARGCPRLRAGYHPPAAANRIQSSSRSTRWAIRAEEVRIELAGLEARREPGRIMLLERQQASAQAQQDQHDAAAELERIEQRVLPRSTTASKGSRPTSRRRGRRCSRR